MTTPGGAVELAQVWVPLMPEASGMAKGVRQIAADAEKRFGRAGAVMGASVAKGVGTAGKSVLETLKQVEARTVAVERAEKAKADAIGRSEVAQKRLNQVNAAAKSTDVQKAAAQEAYNRATRTQELTTNNATRATRALTLAEKDHAAAQKAMNNANVKLPFGARLAAQAEQYGDESGRKFVGGFQRGLGSLSALALGGGVLATARSVVTAGVDMESALNSFQGVTRATGEQMASVQRRARDLGVDTQLAGVSATDATNAMLGLAKGGFDVQQSMDGVRGTLQLATAAQIDAAEAANIQANALHAFNLPVTESARVADLLANVANASTGDIGDFALGLQQAGAVAAGFKIPIEDTVTALGMFANAGIKGSDAGTLMKTSIQALTDQGNPAQGAIKELGLSLYKANGEFVGYPEMLTQVAEASTKMSDEQFQAATNVLFGSDAMRASMIAANGGAAAFKKMKGEVTVVGGAAAMAAANMQGLPGTLEKAKNAAEGAKLAFYDVIKPLLQSGGEKAVGFLNGLAEAFKRIQEGGIFAGFDPATTGIVATLGAIYLKSKLTGPAITAAAKATDVWGNAFSGWKTAAKDAADGMDYVRMSTGETMVQQRGWATGIRDSYRTASSEAERFKRTAGFASSAMTGMKSAGGGVLSLLGGPWGAAALGATTAIGLVAAAHADAAAKAEAQRREEEALQATLDKQTGAATEESKAAIAKRFTDEGTADRAKSYGLDPSALTAAATGDGAAYAQIMATAVEKGIGPGLAQIKFTGPGGKQVDSAAVSTYLGEIGVSSDQLQAALLRQGTAWDDVNAKLRAANPSGQAMVGNLQQLVDAMPDSNESIITLAQNINEVSQQMEGGAEKQRLYNETLNGTWKATKEGEGRFAALGAQILAVPSDKEVRVNALTDDAKSKLEGLGYTVENIKPGEVKVTAETEEAKARIKELIERVESTTVNVHLNPVWGDLGAGRGQAEARRQLGEVVGHGGRAGGGFVDSRGMIHGPGSGTSDSILAQVLGGRGGFVKVGNTESINTAKSTRENWPLIDAMNKGVPAAQLLRQMTGFAEGGIVGLENAVSQLVGSAYSRGGHSPGSVDCSGAASYLVNAALGLPQSDRMATDNAADWLAAKGFMSGPGPSGTLRVGWKNGGPGGGHMAVTLPDGRNAESGGSVGVFTVGGGAAGADDAQFTNQAYLPMEALYPDGSASGSGGGVMGAGGGGGGGGGYSSASAKSSAVTSAQNDVTAAQGKVAEKEQKLAEVKADVNAKDSARIKAENDLVDAKNTLAEKEGKLTDAQSKGIGSSGGQQGSNGGPDVKGFGKDMLSGALSALGFDGEIFSDPTQWGIFKTGTGIANIFGGIAKNWNADGFNAATDGGTDLMKPWRNMGGAKPEGGVGDGGLSDFQFGAGGGGGGVDALGGLLPDVGDFLTNSQTGQMPAGGNSTVNTTTNQNSNNTSSTGQVFNGPVTIQQPVQPKPPERTNTRTTGLPK